MAKTQIGGEQLAPPSGPAGLERAWGGLVREPQPLGSQNVTSLPPPQPLHPERAQLRRASGEQGRLLCN